MHIARSSTGTKVILGLLGLALIAGSGLLAACVPQVNICNTCDPNDPEVDFDFVLTELLFENARLSPAYGGVGCGLDHRQASNGLTQALAYWLAPNDPVCLYWDTFDMVIAPPGSPSVTAVCDLCGDCANLTLSDGTSIGSFALPGAGAPSGGAPQVRLFESQLPNLSQRSVVNTFGWRGGCASNDIFSFPQYSPAPESNVQLAMEAWPSGGSDPQGLTVAGDQAIVVGVPDAPEGFRMPLRLLEETATFDPASPDYHWRIEKTGTRWDEEFSSALRISRIIIFKGRLVKLEPPLMDAVGQPVFFRIEGAEPVVPRRIKFKASQTAYERECYGTADTPEGDYDLGACIFDDPDGNRVTAPRPATPRYGISQSPSGIVLEETLDWVVEFREAGGFVIPELAPDERFAIEFTLEVP